LTLLHGELLQLCYQKSAFRRWKYLQAHAIFVKVFASITSSFRHRRAIAMMFVRPSICLSVSPSVCLSATGVHCDHTVHFSRVFKFTVG